MSNDVRVPSGGTSSTRKIATYDEDQTGVFRKDAGHRWASSVPVGATSDQPCLSRPPFPTAERESKCCGPDPGCPSSFAELAIKRFSMSDLDLSFSVSRDEEYVQLQVVCGAGTFDLGARSRHYLLLTLARRRLEDAAEGLPETTCGWLHQEDLEHDPSMAGPQLNVDVFRIRKQFAALGIVDSVNIVERRQRSRQLRIGTGRIAIVRL
jgi:hypothetical protein